MKIEDYEQLYALWKSCAGMGLNSLDDSREGIARFLARNPDTCLAAVESGRIIGAIMTGNDGRRGYIYHTAVHPDYRRRGIAAELVRQALAALERAGWKSTQTVRIEPGTTAQLVVPIPRGGAPAPVAAPPPDAGAPPAAEPPKIQ